VVLAVLLSRVFLFPRADIEPRAATAAVVSLAGLVSIFIVRSNEHSLASYLLLIPRVIVWGLAAELYVGGLLVATGVGGRALTGSWVALTAMAGIQCLSLGAIVKKRDVPRNKSKEPKFMVGSAEGNLVAVGDDPVLIKNLTASPHQWS
jgi:hypothetical protein